MRVSLVLALVTLAVAKPTKELDYVDDILAQLQQLLENEETGHSVRKAVDQYQTSTNLRTSADDDSSDDDSSDSDDSSEESGDVDDDDNNDKDDGLLGPTTLTEVTTAAGVAQPTVGDEDDEEEEDEDDEVGEEKDDGDNNGSVHEVDDVADPVVTSPDPVYNTLKEALQAKYGDVVASMPFKFLYGEILADVVRDAVVAMLDEQPDDIKELIAVRAARALLETLKDEVFSILRHVIREKTMGALMLSGSMPHQDQLPDDFEPIVNAIFSHLTVDTENALEQISTIFYDDQYENAFTVLANLEKDAAFFGQPSADALEALKTTLSGTLGRYPSDGLLPPGILIDYIANTVNFLGKRLSSMDEMELPQLEFSANGPRVALIMESLQNDLQDEVSEAVGFLHSLENALRGGEDAFITFFSANIARATENVIKRQESSMNAISSIDRDTPGLIEKAKETIDSSDKFKALLMKFAEDLHESGFTQSEVKTKISDLLKGV